MASDYMQSLESVVNRANDIGRNSALAKAHQALDDICRENTIRTPTPGERQFFCSWLFVRHHRRAK